jgi:hypothetical protein
MRPEISKLGVNPGNCISEPQKWPAERGAMMQRPDFIKIAPLSVEHYPEGKAATEVEPGDFILTHGHSFF